MSITGNELADDEDALVEPKKSVLDRVKERRSSSPDLEWFDIPSWGGELKAQLQVLDRSEIDKMVDRIRRRQNGRGVQSGVDADLDFLIKATIGVKAVDYDNDEEQVLTSGFNEELAAMLDPQDEHGNAVDVSTARKLLLYLVKFNTIALASWSAKAARWMQDTSKRVDEDPQ
jgi:hypothetical protein